MPNSRSVSAVKISHNRKFDGGLVLRPAVAPPYELAFSRVSDRHSTLPKAPFSPHSLQFPEPFSVKSQMEGITSQYLYCRSDYFFPRTQREAGIELLEWNREPRLNHALLNYALRTLVVLSAVIIVWWAL
jgi:hypothetical protein